MQIANDAGRAFTGLLFPKADGIYTIKPNFIERGPLSMLSEPKPRKLLSTMYPVKAIASDVRRMKIFFYEYETNVSSKFRKYISILSVFW